MMFKLGLLLDCPSGEPDELWFARRGGPWEQVPLDGAWFPDAFIGPMANLQRVAAGEDDRLATAVEDAWKTMALVEACYRAAAAPAYPIPTERSEEHTSELQSLMRISNAVFCLKNKKTNRNKQSQL